jgi:hypothetical protein
VAAEGLPKLGVIVPANMPTRIFSGTLRGTVPPKDTTPTALKRDPSQNLVSTIHYFAYGSNMSTPRLRYRVPGCRFEFVARLPSYRLCFHKRSKDGSAKCNAFKTAEPTDAVIGCVYEIPTNEKPAFDRAEGLGPVIAKRSSRCYRPKVEKSWFVRTSPMRASLTTASNPIRGTRTSFSQVPKSIGYLRNM